MHAGHVIFHGNAIRIVYTYNYLGMRFSEQNGTTR